MSSEISTPPNTRLLWQVHLLRRQPQRLAGIVFAVPMAGLLVWMTFGQWLPALIAMLLLCGACSEYLLPVTYRLTDEGIYAESLTSRFVLKWTEARRCLVGTQAVLLTPLPAPSRLDNFRGVLLRCAPDGEPGDKNSILRVVAECAPALLQTASPPLPSETMPETPVTGADA